MLLPNCLNESNWLKCWEDCSLASKNFQSSSVNCTFMFSENNSLNKSLFVLCATTWAVWMRLQHNFEIQTVMTKLMQTVNRFCLNIITLSQTKTHFLCSLTCLNLFFLCWHSEQKSDSYLFFVFFSLNSLIFVFHVLLWMTNTPQEGKSHVKFL